MTALHTLIRATAVALFAALIGLAPGLIYSQGATDTATPSPTPQPTPTHTPTSSLRFVASTWMIAARGLEYGMYFPPYSAGAQLFVIRIDPDHFIFRAHYRPDDPLDRAGWQHELSGETAFVNANFYLPPGDGDGSVLADGLVVTDGIAHGQAFTGFGGLLQVDTDGIVRVRSTIREPYAGEPLTQAVQGFPMLVHDGRPAYTRPDADEVTRRTAVGIDRRGRILIFSTPGLGIELTTLAHYLPMTDLNLISAVNLDGGTSSLLQFNPPDAERVQIDSQYPVPVVLGVYPRTPSAVCAAIVCDA